MRGEIFNTDFSVEEVASRIANFKHCGRSWWESMVQGENKPPQGFQASIPYKIVEMEENPSGENVSFIITKEKYLDI